MHGQYLHVARADGIVIAIYSTWPRADGGGLSHGWDPIYEFGDGLRKKFR